MISSPKRGFGFQHVPKAPSREGVARASGGRPRAPSGRPPLPGPGEPDGIRLIGHAAASTETRSRGAANDSLVGDRGNGALNGGPHDDYLQGGRGTDVATYIGATGKVFANLSTGHAGGAAGNDTLSQVEYLSGSRFDDTLIGNAQPN